MDKLIKAAIGIISLTILFFTAYGIDFVAPGNVGIIVRQAGVDRGVEDMTTANGYVLYNRWTQRVYEYPTSLQRTDFSKKAELNESVSFNATGGVSVEADLALHYQIAANDAPHVFVKLRNNDTQNIEQIVAVRQYLYSKVREVVGNIAATMTIEDIYNNKLELMAKAKTQLQENIGPQIKIETLTFVSSLRIDPTIQEGINKTISQVQATLVAQSKVAQSKAEADQMIEDARGRAESVLLEANKQAEANTTLAKSLTPELVNWQAITKWNGQLPNVTSGAVPFIQVPGVSK